MGKRGLMASAIARAKSASQKEWESRWQSKENLLSNSELRLVSSLLRTELEQTPENEKRERWELGMILEKIESTNGYSNVPRTSFPFTRSIRETKLHIKKLKGVRN